MDIRPENVNEWGAAMIEEERRVVRRNRKLFGVFRWRWYLRRLWYGRDGASPAGY